MALKKKYEKETDIPAEIKHEYKKQEDGTWELEVEGESDEIKKHKEILKEFRENNIKLSKEREEMLKKYKDVDPEAYRKHLEEKKKLEDEKAIAEGKAQELLARQNQEHEQRLKDVELKAQEAVSSYKTKYHKNKIRTWLAQNAPKHGRVRAIENDKGKFDNLDFMSDDAEKFLTVDDNDQVVLKVEQRNAKGFAVTSDEWLSEAAKTRYSGLYEASAGGGAIGNTARTYAGEKTVSREQAQQPSATMIEAIATNKAKVV
jgi:hypothetical protein